MCLDVAERSRQPSWHTVALALSAGLSYAEGGWQAIRDSYDQQRAVAPTVRFIMLSAIQMLGEYQTGNVDQADAYLQELLQSSSSPSRVTMLLRAGLLSLAIASRITGNESLHSAVTSAADSVLSTTNATPYTVSSAREALVNIAIQQGDTEQIEDLYVALQPLRGTMSAFGLESIDHLLGLLAHAIGKLGDAQTHFEDALAFCRKAGYRPELAWSLCDYADMLRERNGEGDHEKAVSLLDESLAISTELGMRPLMERVLSRREILKA